jgi:DNA-binding MarR family transcriptional regulator
MQAPKRGRIVDKLDPIIHQPVRLRIMAVLAGMGKGEEVDFTYLKRVLGVTDGNLGAHLLKLEQAGYIEVSKTFVNRKPKTYIQVSGKGLDDFRAHIRSLQQIIDSGTNGGSGDEK